MPAFSFIHAADLHLDSPFASMAKENPDIASEMRDAAFTAFENIIRLCIEKKADFLLIAGDVYDGEDRSLRAQVRFREGLKRLSDAGINTYVVHGNHDPLNSWSASLDWPEGVRIFRDRHEICHAERNGSILAVIQGISYPNRDEHRNLSLMFKRTESSAFHIGLLHANAGNNTGYAPYAPCSPADLKGAGMDYWALGHVHEKKVLNDYAPVILYPGNTQGRSVRETGKRGCFFIRVDEQHNIEKEFFPVHAVEWRVEEIPGGNFTSEQDIIKCLEQKCAEISENDLSVPTVVRFILTGRGHLSNYLMNPVITEDLLEITREAGISCSPYVWVEQIRSQVQPEFNFKAISRQEDFPGELYRYFKGMLNGAEFDRFIKEELSDLFDNSRAVKMISPPEKKRMEALLEKAGNICLEGLLKGKIK